MEHEKITHKIIGLEYKVHNQLGFGFFESIYKKALCLELADSGIKFEVEKPLKVYYSGHVVGDFFMDVFVENAVVVELKSVQKLAKEHGAQLVNYLKALNRDIGLLINFGQHGVEIQRKYRDPKMGIRQD
jgi:GxxExxY protein